MVHQFQVRRQERERLHVKLVVSRELVQRETELLERELQERFQYPFRITISYHDELAPSKATNSTISGMSTAKEAAMPDSLPPQVRSALAGMAWPGLPSALATHNLALLYQLEHSQWLPAEELLCLQFRQINLLLRHAFETVPYNRDRREAWGIEFDHAITADEYCQRIPILTRAEVQELGDELLSAEVPQSHGKPGSVFTSGSTGMPIKVIKTELAEIF